MRVSAARARCVIRVRSGPGQLCWADRALGGSGNHLLRGAAAEAPAPGTYSVYSELAAGRLTANNPRNRDGFFTVSFTTRGRASQMPSGLRETGTSEWKPIGTLVVTDRNKDRLDGRLEYTSEGRLMPSMKKVQFRVEGSFETLRDPRLRHYEQTATGVMGG